MRVFTGCTDVREEFSALLDGELEPEEREAVEAHLADCSECLRALDGLKRVDTLFATLPRVDAPEGFEARVRAARRPGILRFPERAVPRGRAASIMAAAAVLVMVAGVSFVTLRDGQPANTFEMGKAAQDETAPTAQIQSGQGGAMARQSLNASVPDALDAPAAPQEESIAGFNDVSVGRISAPAEPEMQSERFDAVFEESIEQDRIPEPEPMPAPAPPAAAMPSPVAESPRNPGASELTARAAEKKERAEEGKDLAELRTLGDRDAVAAERTMENAQAPARRAEAAKALSAPADDESAPTRVLAWRDGEWFQEDYDGETLTPVGRNSAAFKAMIEQDDELAAYLLRNDAVIFRYEETWYRLPPAS